MPARPDLSEPRTRETDSQAERASGGIGRAFTKLSEVGPGYLLTLIRRKLVPTRLFDRSRLIMLELMLPGAPAAKIENAEIRWAKQHEVDLLCAFGHTPVLLHERFAAGDRPCVITLEGRLAGYAWFRRDHFDEGQLSARFRFGPEEVWLYDGMVAPDLRGRGLYPALVRGAASLLAAEGFSRMLIQVEAHNHNAVSGHRAAGAVPIATYSALRVLGRTRLSDDLGSPARWSRSNALHDVEIPSAIRQPETSRA